MMMSCSGKLAEVTIALSNLQTHVDALRTAEDDRANRDARRPAAVCGAVETSVERYRGDLELAFAEFYLNLVYLQQYQTLNFVGFTKIITKYERVSRSFENNVVSFYLISIPV